MRFVWAVVAFLAAVGLIGGGVAQLTVLRGPDTVTSEVAPADEELAYTLVDSAVLAQHPGQQTLTAAADGEVFAAYGRTTDLEAWLSDVSYNHATLDEGEVSVESVDATDVFADLGERGTVDPRGSDLWIEEQVADGELTEQFTLPEGMSLLLATDGAAPAPQEVSVSWPVTVTTPWAGPLIVAGGIALVIGLVLWVLGMIHLRRRRGPRRKGPQQPSRRAIGGRRGGRREVGPGARRAFAAIPAFVLAGAVLAGCSPTAWPDLSSAPAPTPTEEETAQPDEEQQTPAMTQAQSERIVTSIAQTVQKADEERDLDRLGSRMTDTAYELRSVNYDIRGEVSDHAMPPAIPEGPVQVLLPQANDGWPRTALVVVGEEDGETSPTIFTMTQSDPWSRYKASYIGTIGPNVEIPALAPAWLGAALVPPDSSFLQIAPDQIGRAYADVIAKGEDSEYASLFDLENDPFRAALKEKRDTTRTHFDETAESDDLGERTAEIDFSQGASDAAPVALATLDSGAIVSVALRDWETIRATNEDATIQITDPLVQHLTGEEETATGVQTRYESELFFFVPARAAEEPIRLLGFGYGIVGSEILPEEDEDAGE
ncbi:glycosyl transferase [Microbacterium sp. gxy059]|uniref:glycosyl transferase n=1 Tax=Microbacterium sp. gxy059 TaxID=2957199 RepID=UPI003D9895D7